MSSGHSKCLLKSYGTVHTPRASSGIDGRSISDPYFEHEFLRHVVPGTDIPHMVASLRLVKARLRPLQVCVGWQTTKQEFNSVDGMDLVHKPVPSLTI